MIEIPKTRTVVNNQMTGACLHYELQEDKCTKRLVVYKCLENGCLESWQRTDFMKKINVKNGEQPSKYERRKK